MSKEQVKEVLLRLSEKQTEVVLEALELYARLGTGQVEHIDEVKFMMDKGPDYPTKREKLDELKSLYFPGMHPNQSHGIRSEKTPEECKVAYDIVQVVRHDLSWARQSEGGNGVNFQKPYQVSEQEDLCTCKITKE